MTSARPTGAPRAALAAHPVGEATVAEELARARAQALELARVLARALELAQGLTRCGHQP